MGGEGKRKIMINPMYFPEELFIEILSRLPVKSLFRFKCVCKSWCNQISAKDFPFLHLNNYKPSHLVLAGIYHPLNLSTAYVSLSPPTSPFVCMSRNKIVHYRLPQQHSFDKSSGLNPEVCGPCNGIFCLYRQGKERILLWNPQIQDFKIIPRSNLPRQAILQRGTLHFNYTVGFAFDSETNDYKILKIVQNPSVHPLKLQQLELYSLRTNSWRKLDAAPLNSFCVSDVLFTTTYGKIGWLGNQRQIFLFDVSDETFDTIPVSLDDGECQSKDKTLQVFPFRESIAVVISTYGYCEIWVLNDFTCTHSRSWSKLWTVQVKNLWPLGFYGNSYLIFRGWHKYKVMLYDLLNNDVVNVGASMVRALVYKESLISISGDNWAR